MRYYSPAGTSISPARADTNEEVGMKASHTVTFTASNSPHDEGAQTRLYVNNSSPSSNLAVTARRTVAIVNCTWETDDKGQLEHLSTKQKAPADKASS